MAHLSSVVIKIEGIRVFVTARKINHLDETAETKVLLDDDVCCALAEDRVVALEKLTIDGSHDEADLGGIGCAGEVSVDLLGLVLVQADETVQDVVAGRSVVVATLVVGEVVLHGADRQLLLEAIDLVQEQDNRRLDEPPRVADGVEQGQGLLHSVDCLIFEQQLIVLGDGDEEEDGGNVLEAVNPLLSLGSLTTDIEHSVGEVTDDEGGLGDTSGLDTRPKDILIVRHVVGGRNSRDVIKVAIRGKRGARGN